MKMYKESLRRLLPVGALFAVLALLYTVVNGGQDCFGTVKLMTAKHALGVTPALNYYVFTGAFFALYGFSFLFKRSASDLMLAMPVRRADHFWSVTLATATWMGGTIVLCTLSMLFILLVSGCPFVPGYIAMNLAFYFIAAMLVYAAAAIACAISGTALTAAVSALLVLFLPRFVQFIIARGVVANVPIVGWLDLSPWLDPSTNVATGLIVMWSRNQFIERMVTMPHILYSLLPMAAELALGAWLFIRRPSERAEKGASGRGWTLATATLLAFAILLVIAVDNQRLISFSGRRTVYRIVIVVVALLAFAIYQLLATRDWKRLPRTAPCFVLAVAVAFGVAGAIRLTTNAALNVTPAADEIASVTFRGHDNSNGATDYATLLVSKVQFTDEAMRAYVSDALGSAVGALRAGESDTSYRPNMVIEPITLRLTDGREVKRTIEFADSNSLNALRQRESDEFRAAIRAFPDERSVQYRLVDSRFTADEQRAIIDSFIAESSKLGVISAEYYRPDQLTSSDVIARFNGDQRFAGFQLAGYVGTRRYTDYYNLRMETPDTAALYMRTCNAYGAPDSPARLNAAVQRYVSGEAPATESLSFSLSAFNLLSAGEKGQCYHYYYLSADNAANDENYPRTLEYAARFAELLARGVPTDVSSGFFVSLQWNQYDRAASNERVSESEIYLGFSAADEQAMIDLLQEWYQANTSTGRG